MDTIICLVGPSGSGKTTIAKMLADAGYNVIQSYTTRPPREEGEWGHTFGKVLMHGKDSGVIASNRYNGYHYWATREQYQGKGVSVYVVDPPGVNMLRETVQDAKIVVVYLQVDTVELVNRMRKDRRPLADIGNRLGYDQEAFRVVPCDYAITNNDNPKKAVEWIKKEWPNNAD